MIADIEGVARHCAAPYGEAEPTVWKGALHDPSEFFGERQLREMLYDPRLFARVGLFRNQELMTLGSFPGVGTVAGVMQYRREGVSLVLRGVQRRIGHVRFACQEFARIGGWPTVHAVAFETPEGVSALAPHWDPYPVVTCQTYGRKRWYVFTPFERDEAVVRRRLETEGESAVCTFTEGQLTRLSPKYAAYTVLLEPGDVFSVPAGWPHFAVGDGGSSLHVSICPMPQHVLERFGNEDHELVS